MISSADIGWVAGFLEGEGYFGMSNSESLFINASQVQLDPLERLQRLLGGKITGPYKPCGSSNGNPYHRWHSGPKLGAQVMMTIYPFMSPKRQASIRKCLSTWKVQIGWTLIHARKSHCPRGHAYTPENTYENPHRKNRNCRLCRNRKRDLRVAVKAWT